MKQFKKIIFCLGLAVITSVSLASAVVAINSQDSQSNWGIESLAVSGSVLFAHTNTNDLTSTVEDNSGSITKVPMNKLDVDGNGFGGAVSFQLWWHYKLAHFITSLEYSRYAEISKSVNPAWSPPTFPSPNSFATSLRPQTVFVNLLWRYQFMRQLSLLLGGGIGEAFNHSGSTMNFTFTPGISSSDPITRGTAKFAWNLQAGLLYALTQHWFASASFRYVDFGGVDFGTFFVKQPISSGTNVSTNKLDSVEGRVSIGYKL